MLSKPKVYVHGLYLYTHVAHIGRHFDVLLEEGGLHVGAAELDDFILGAGRVAFPDA